MSYQNLNALVAKIQSALTQLENKQLSVSDIDSIQENAKELFERLTVLKYLALEKLVESTDPSKKVKTADENREASAEDADIPVAIKISASEPPIPENQTNLLDPIKESKEEVSEPEIPTDDQSLNEKLNASPSAASLSEKLKKQPINDLITAIGINQKFLFMNDLFEGERDEFHNSLSELNKFDSFLDADNYIKNNLMVKYNWDMENQSVVRFMELVERRYLG
jgi:hypothetical protein